MLWPKLIRLFPPRKRHLRYDNLYDWFVGENVPDRFAFLDDPAERDKWITQYGELRQHLYDKHVATLPLDKQRQIKQGRHPSQSHSLAEEARPYADRLAGHLAELGYAAKCEIGFYHMELIVLSAELDHVPELQEYGKLLPLYYEGFQVKYHGPTQTSISQSQHPPTSD